MMQRIDWINRIIYVTCGGAAWALIYSHNSSALRRLARECAWRFTTIKEAQTSQSQFPAGWDAARVQRLIEHDKALSQEEQTAEDEAAANARKGEAIITAPDELLPAIRQLLARHKSA